jgi:tetratricopeptide (TPR) repeat protein
VNLRGFDPTGTPVTPAEAVRGFLDAFEVPTNRIPTAFEAQVGLFRSLLADRRVLVVLDNARDTDQVRPLLAGSPGCLVLVTSRILLTGLVAGGAHPLAVDLLCAEESLLLLAGRLGADRVAAEPVAVNEIVDLCARLPLAMAVVAARAATHPRFSLAALAGELRAATGGLDEFADDDPATDPRAVFSWSYLRLSDAAARMFRLFGLHTGPDIGARAAASLAALPLNKARPLLAELARAHLVAEHRPGRYSLHDLLRAYASELAQEIDPAADRRAALRRVLVHYVHSAYAADGLIDPQREELPGLVELVAGVTPEVVADHGAALSWFAGEHRVLLSVLHQEPEFDAEVWELTWTLRRFLTYQGHWQDGFEVTTSGMAAGRRLGDLAKEAFSQSHLGCTHVWFDQYAEAATWLDKAIELYRRAGNPVGEAYTEHYHAWSLDRQGRDVEALAHAERSLELFGSAGHERGQARMLNAVGWFHARIEDLPAAIGFCEKALELQTKLGDSAAAAQTWHSLGYIYEHLGDHPRAVECYRASVAGFRAAGYLYSEALILTSLGDAHFKTGDLAAARDAWERSVEIYDRLDHSDAAETRAKLRRITEMEEVGK